MVDLTALPRELTTGPATMNDAQAVFELISACEADVDGKAEVDADDVVADFARPALNLEHDTLLVHERDELIGWAQVYEGRRADADVRPSHRGRGIGTEILG